MIGIENLRKLVKRPDLLIRKLKNFKVKPKNLSGLCGGEKTWSGLLSYLLLLYLDGSLYDWLFNYNTYHLTYNTYHLTYIHIIL